MKKLLISLLTFAMVLTAAPLDAFAASPSVIADKPEDGVTFDQPFAPGTGGSPNFRIPALATLEDGTVLAGIDARWNTSADGGGLDTIVSISEDDGDTWYYTYANHLGDNGNVWNGNSSCFIDPAFAVDGNKVYMMVDLWPGGYALNGANRAPIAGQNGFDEDGHLRLTDVLNNNSSSVAYNYYLAEKTDGTLEDCYEIRKYSDDTVVEGYTIDAYYNITSETESTNLFYWESPFKVYPTNYLWLNSSTDGGKTWSVPTLVDVKYEAEQTFLVAPGTGLVVDKPDGTKRIIFTGYEFTSGDKNSWAIYSDDGGLTWERGGKCSGWSSESTITQVGETIYIFTRHGGYYTSEDYGETWSARKEPGITYNSNCMIHSITYSKKIDGKDAILLSAPSNTSSRKDGKIFVGLVEEDGSLNWKYEYAIDNSGNNNYYAYSCLTELKDGRIALLYENKAAGAKYEVFTIEELAGNVAVGDYQLTYNNEIINEFTLAQDQAVITINNVTDETVTAVSGAEDVVTTSVSGNQLTISKADLTSGKAEIIVTINDNELKLNVTVVPADVSTTETIELTKGEEATITLDGDYSGEALEGLDETIATVELIGSDIITYGAQTGTDASYSGDKISLDDCLMTFTKGDGENEYSVTRNYNGTTLYLGTRASSTAGKPVSTTETTVNVVAQGNDKFSFVDNAPGTTGGYLYFWSDAKLRFDRNGSAAGDNTSFYVLKKADTAEGQIIPGWNSVTEFTSGNSYLIATVVNNVTYVLRPTTGDSAYDYVAKALTQSETVGTTEYKVTAKEAGNTSVTIGDTVYFIDVTSQKESYTIGVNETVKLPGEITKIDDDTIISAAVSETAVGGPYERVSGEVQTGQYLIGNESHLTAHEIIKDSWAQTGIKLQACDFENGVYEESLWTITKVEGGYTIQASNGKYVTFKDKDGSSASIALEDTPQTVQITTKGSGYDVSYVLDGTKYYFNNFGGANVNKLIAGYTGNSVEWGIYKPTSCPTTITGLKAGTTSCYNAANAEYEITVVESADYARVDSALALVAQAGDLSQYTAESAAAVNAAVDAVERGLPYSAQDEVNAMAANIILAVNKLIKQGEEPEVNKTALNAAIRSAEALDTDDYVDFTSVAAALESAKAVSIDEDATQEEVNNALTALNTAVAALEEKPPLPGDEYIEIPTDEMTATAGNAHSGHDKEGPASFAIDGDETTMWHTDWYPSDDSRDDHWLQITFDEVKEINGMKVLQRAGEYPNGRILKYDLYARTSENGEWQLVVENGTLENTGEWQTVTFDAVEAKEVRLYAIETTGDQPGKAFSAIAEIRFTETGAEVEQLADYSAVNEAIARAEDYSAEMYNGYEAVTAAIEAVVKGLRVSDQATVDGFAKAINDAIDALELKDADYTVVEEALANVPEDLSIYTEESVAELEAAIAAVVEGLKADKQADVNEMAAAINEAIEALEEKYVPADKEALNAAITSAEALDAEDYVDFTAVAEALGAAKEVAADEEATQEEVDAAVAALDAAVKALEKKPAKKPFPFTDVSEKQWYYGVIDEAYQLGLLTGATDTLFKPNANMNRAMVACVFHRMEGSKPTAWQEVFSDVISGEYYSGPVTWAKLNGVINGYKNGTFKPLQNITREEMATMIYNFAKYKGLDVSATQDITGYTDYAKITPYARVTLQWAVENGLMSGKLNGTKLDPLGLTTRAEASKMLVNAYKVIYK